MSYCPGQVQIDGRQVKFVGNNMQKIGAHVPEQVDLGENCLALARIGLCCGFS